jgi:hypothetical protein
MTLGTGIFLSAVVISIVMLFSITKDRWSWRKGFKRIGIALLVLICVGVAIYFAWAPIQAFVDRPKPFQELGGVKVGASQDDVKFLKGLPDAACTISTLKDWSLWAYRLTTAEDKSPTWLIVTFMGAHGAWSIYIRSDDAEFNQAPVLEHVDKFETVESINKRFGPATEIRPSDDGLSREYAFRRYNLRVAFTQGHVSNYGIFYHPNAPDMSPIAPDSKQTCVDKEGKPLT